MPRRNETGTLKISLHASVCSSGLYSQRPSHGNNGSVHNGRVEREDGVQVDSRILCGHKMKPCQCDHIEEPGGHHAMRNKPDREMQILRDTTYKRNFLKIKTIKLTETESRVVAAGGWAGAGNGALAAQVQTLSVVRGVRSRGPTRSTVTIVLTGRDR